MSLIELTHVIEGTLGPLTNAGAPTAGTNQVQTLTFSATPTGGTFVLAFDGQQTAPINWSSTNATLVSNIDTALEALPNIGAGGITTAAGTLTAGVGTITLTSAGNLAKRAYNSFTVADDSLTGSGSVSIATTTPGVNATGRGAATGALLTDTVAGKLYINSGTPTVPVWTVTGTQS